MRWSAVAVCGLAGLVFAAPARSGWTYTVLHPPTAGLSGGFSVTATDQAGFAFIPGTGHVAVRWTGSAASWQSLAPAGSTESDVWGSAGTQQVGSARIGGVTQAGTWAGSAASWVSLHPTGTSASVVFATTGTQQAGVVHVSLGSGRAAIWSGTATSWIDLHPSGYGISFAHATNGTQQAGYADNHAGIWSGTAASWVDLHPASAGVSKALATTGTRQAGFATFGGIPHAGTWTGSAASFVDLHPSGAQNSSIDGMTGAYQVGRSQIAGWAHAGIWAGSAASWLDLHDVLSDDYQEASEANAIFKAGTVLHVVGAAMNTVTGESEAILWTCDTGSQTVYSLLGGGRQTQIGNGLPLPLQTATTGMGTPIGTMTMFPPLGIPIRTGAVVRQSGCVNPKRMIVPPRAFELVPNGPTVLGVAKHNPKVFQVQTNIGFTDPGPFDHVFGGPVVSSAVLDASGRTGAATTTFTGTPPGSFVRYTKTAAQFGGPSQTMMIAATPIRIWGHGHKAPCKHPVFGGSDLACVAQVFAAYPGSMIAAGAQVGFTTMTPGGPAPMSPNVVFASVPQATGLLAMSASAVMSGAATNAATSLGFPWTTGMITISQPGALGSSELFTITGMDSRNAGIGTISLVAGALSNRTFSGPNANRAWVRYTLPEPEAIMGAAAALAMLAVSHHLVRRRSR